MRLSRSSRQKPRLMAEINVVPYIDVMLVLLIIFMITAPLLNQGVTVNLPQAKAKVLTPDREPIIVSVNQKGDYFLNIAEAPMKPLPAFKLTQAVKEALTKAEKASLQRQVLVKGDKNAAYGNIVQAMVLLQQAGVENVGLMTDETETQQK